jgi:hypothetical protein
MQVPALRYVPPRRGGVGEPLPLRHDHLDDEKVLDLGVWCGVITPHDTHTLRRGSQVTVDA